MKTGRSLEEVAQELSRQRVAKRDFVGDTKGMNFVVNDDDQVALEMAGVGDVMPLRQTAHRQFAIHAAIPKPYYDRMLENAPDLLATNMNHWLAQKESKRMVRTLDGQVRALLSNRYRPLDNAELAEAILPSISKYGARVDSCEITDDRFYLKVVRPDLKAEVMPPGAEWGKGHTAVDVVQAGFVAQNSEVGFGALGFYPAIHTIRCTNLATFKEQAMRQTHVGRKHEDGEYNRYLSDETRQAEDRAFWGKARDLAIAAMDGRVFNDLVKSLQETRERRIEADVKRTVEVVANKFTMTQEEQEGVLEHLIRGGDLSQYGMHSAITRLSQDVESYDRASELERLGGQIIELPANSWRRVNELAKQPAVAL